MIMMLMMMMRIEGDSRGCVLQSCTLYNTLYKYNDFLFMDTAANSNTTKAKFRSSLIFVKITFTVLLL